MYEDKLNDFEEESKLLCYFARNGINDDSINGINKYINTGKEYTVTGRRRNAVQFGKFIISCNDDENTFYVSVLDDDEFGTINDPEFRRSHRPILRVMCDLW